MASRLTAAFNGPARSKLVCRLLMILFSTVTLALLIAIAAIGTTVGDYADDYTPFVAGLATMAPGWCLIHSIISFFLYLYRTTYHPGWDVGFDLISWLLQLAWACTLFPIWASPETSIYCLDDSNIGPGYCDNPLVRTQVRAEMAASSFLLVNGLLTFAYFCRACRRTELLRRQRWMERGQRASVELGERQTQRSKNHEEWEVPPIEGRPPTYTP